jgi:hypothetical protein
VRSLRDAGSVRRVASRVAAICAAGFAALAVVAAIGPVASYADGPQDEPVLVPASVDAATDAFAIRPPIDARCDGTGADNWRWHGFIVEKGRDVSTLRFGPLGPGSDYNATDGKITAPLMTAGGEGVWQKLPALKPEGHINPDELAGLELDPAVYKFRAGEYQLGFACTDGALATRGWWVTTVTISPSSSPFMTAASAAHKPAATAASTTVPAGAAAKDASTTTTSAAAAVPPAAQKGAGDGDQATPSPVEPAASDAARDTADISWAPLKVVRPVPGLVPMWIWALLAVVFARVAYLFSRPARIRKPRRAGGAPSRRNTMMNGIRSRFAMTTMLVAVTATLVVALVAVRPAAAANGAQSPAPALLPSEVATASTAFSLDFASAVLCDGTGAQNWRVNTFIVEAGVNLADLDFQAGPAPGYIGADFDATDGTIAAPLFRGSDEAGVNLVPAATPAGLIDPAALAGYSFDPSVWTLADGNYQVGFACTDGALATRQWWSTTVTIDADASPNAFMRAASTSPTTTVPGQTTTTVPGQTTTTVAGQTTTTTIPDEETTTTTSPDEESTTTSTTFEDTTNTTSAIDTSDTGDSGSFDDGSGSSGDGSGGSDLPTTGVGLGLVAVGAAFLYVGRMLYLLSKRRSVTAS